jgi:hypothetical protein
VALNGPIPGQPPDFTKSLPLNESTVQRGAEPAGAEVVAAASVASDVVEKSGLVLADSLAPPVVTLKFGDVSMLAGCLVVFGLEVCASCLDDWLLVESCPSLQSASSELSSCCANAGSDNARII